MDNSFLRKELVRFSIPCTRTKYNDIKDVFPWVSRCMFTKIRMENFIRDNELFVDSSPLITCKVTEIEVKDLVKFLMRNDNA